MSNIIIFEHSNPSIKYVARTVTTGDELAMVQRYLASIKKTAKALKRKQIAVFVEPRIETGFPDLVIVEYYLPPNDIWCQSRMELNNTDLKILMHIISSSGPRVKVSALCELLGYEKEIIIHSLKKLYKCKLIYLSKSQESVRKVAIEKWCRIRKIVAVEAKIDKWHRAIEQANRNTWFATDSFVLLNKARCNQKVYDLCRQQGIGIILQNGRIDTILNSEHKDFPISYASLQFNEWIQRYLHNGVI